MANDRDNQFQPVMFRGDSSRDAAGHVLFHLHQLVNAVERLTEAVEKVAAISARLETGFHLIQKGIATMSRELDRLTQSVNDENTVIDSAVTLLGQLADLIRALPADAAAITALADQVDAKKDAIAAAVVANTPTPPTT